MLTVILNAVVVMLLTCLWFVYEVVSAIRDGRQGATKEAEDERKAVIF